MSAPIAPGATIGFLGGGQLGRMTALAARAMGFRIHVLDPDAECAAAAVADRVVAASFDDAEAARDLARNCQVVTLEIEQVATSVLDAAQIYAPARPNANVIGIIQDRSRQKRWLAEHGFPVGPYRDVSSASETEHAIREFGSCYLKSTRGGYDGRSQMRVAAGSDPAEAWRALGARAAVAEQALELAGELSVLVARRPGGASCVFPVALNHHERQVLAWSVTPAPLPAAITKRAVEVGRGIADAMAIEGLLAVELFLSGAGEILVNELAPRPHNSFHATERACVTSQFEQLTRAVCDWPLGDVGIVRPTAIVNVFGDIWKNDTPPDLSPALSDSSVRAHLYGKRGARAGRKMGHLSAVGGSALDALTAARAAARRIGVETEELPSAIRSLLG
jgi:5-(carboxyamino)imidazole ribonucleotide synthase